MMNRLEWIQVLFMEPRQFCEDKWSARYLIPFFRLIETEGFLFSGGICAKPFEGVFWI